MLCLKVSSASIRIYRIFGPNIPLFSLLCTKRVNQASSYTQKKGFYTSLLAYSSVVRKTNLYKDIYKEIGYKSPFSDDENFLILKLVNESSEKQLCEVTAKGKAASIFEHKQEHGIFSVVEELLSVKNFDEKVLERLGKKVIKLHSPKDDNSAELSNLPCSEERRLEKIKTKLLKYINPKLKAPEYQSDIIKTIVGIKLTFYNLSYAHMDKTTENILSWDSVPCFEAKEDTQHPNLFHTALKITNQIPSADLYVFEEQLPMLNNKSDPNLMSKGISLKLRSTFLNSGQFLVHVPIFNMGGGKIS